MPAQAGPGGTPREQQVTLWHRRILLHTAGATTSTSSSSSRLRQQPWWGLLLLLYWLLLLRFLLLLWLFLLLLLSLLLPLGLLLLLLLVSAPYADASHSPWCGSSRLCLPSKSPTAAAGRGPACALPAVRRFATAVCHAAVAVAAAAAAGRGFSLWVELLILKCIEKVTKPALSPLEQSILVLYYCCCC
jgi:hypothetical protein